MNGCGCISIKFYLKNRLLVLGPEFANPCWTVLKHLFSVFCFSIRGPIFPSKPPLPSTLLSPCGLGRPGLTLDLWVDRWLRFGQTPYTSSIHYDWRSGYLSQSRQSQIKLRDFCLNSSGFQSRWLKDDCLECLNQHVKESICFGWDSSTVRILFSGKSEGGTEVGLGSKGGQARMQCQAKFCRSKFCGRWGSSVDNLNGKVISIRGRELGFLYLYTCELWLRSTPG